MQIFIRAWFTIMLLAWSVVEAKDIDEPAPIYFGVTAYRQAYHLGEDHAAARRALTKIKRTSGPVIFYSLHYEPGVQKYWHAPELSWVEARGLIVSLKKSPRTPHLLNQVLLSFRTTTGYITQKILLTRNDFFIAPQLNQRKFVIRQAAADRILKAFNVDHEWDLPASLDFDLFATDSYRYFTFRPGRSMLNKIQVERVPPTLCAESLQLEESDDRLR